MDKFIKTYQLNMNSDKRWYLSHIKKYKYPTEKCQSCSNLATIKCFFKDVPSYWVCEKCFREHFKLSMTRYIIEQLINKKQIFPEKVDTELYGIILASQDKIFNKALDDYLNSTKFQDDSYTPKKSQKDTSIESLQRSLDKWYFDKKYETLDTYIDKKLLKQVLILECLNCKEQFSKVINIEKIENIAWPRYISNEMLIDDVWIKIEHKCKVNKIKTK